jgi:hypothetical protein
MFWIPYLLISLSPRKHVHYSAGQRGTSHNPCMFSNHFALFGAHLCVRRPLEAKGKGIRRVRGVENKEEYTVHTMSVMSLVLQSICVVSLLPNI